MHLLKKLRHSEHGTNVMAVYANRLSGCVAASNIGYQNILGTNPQINLPSCLFPW